MSLREIKNEILMDARSENDNSYTFCTTSRSSLQFKRVQRFAITTVLISTLAGCNYLTANVSGAIGTFKLTNNGAHELAISDNGSHTFPNSMNTGDRYDVDVVPGSDTSQGHLCAVTGGSNGDGSGAISGSSISDLVVVNCVGI